jgi:RimJ/RimL family protein N-acetyltransferase
MVTPAVQPPSPWLPPSPLPAAFATDRLLLRSWQPTDAAGMLAAIESGRDRLLPWLPWAAVDNRNIAQCTAAIERMRRNWERTEPPPDDFTLAIIERDSAVPLGGTGLHRINADRHEAEIGYWVRPDRHGQGICTDAVAALISWAFRPQSAGGWGLRRIHIRCAGGNFASQRVPRKLGLREEGRHAKERWVDGRGWDDTLVWGVLADEWDVDGRRVRHARA